MEAHSLQQRTTSIPCSQPSWRERSKTSFKKLEAEVASSCDLLQTHPIFEKAILLIIVFNACWIGIDIDWNEGEDSEVPPITFLIVENIFCVLFTVELLIRVLAYEQKLHFFRNSYNLFDLFLVVMMIIEVWVLAALQTAANLKQVSLFRLLRLLRLLRISRIFRMVPELGMMVKSLAAAARSVSSTFFLEVGIMYVFAVICTQWAKSHDNPCFSTTEDEECAATAYFGSIAKSFLSLLQILVFDDTFAIIRPVLKDTWYVGVLLITFMVIGSFTVLNMLIGIICEIVSTTTQDEKNKMLMNRVKEVFATIDMDNSGTVSRDEFNGDALRQMKRLGIDQDILDNAFEILDDDRSGFFDLDNFYSMIFKLLHPPQSQDILKLSQKLNAIGKQVGLPPDEAPRRLSVVSVTDDQLKHTLDQVKEHDPGAMYKLREIGKAQKNDASGPDVADGPPKGWTPAASWTSSDFVAAIERGLPKQSSSDFVQLSTAQAPKPILLERSSKNDTPVHTETPAKQEPGPSAATSTSNFAVRTDQQEGVNGKTPHQLQAMRVLSNLHEILGEQDKVDKVLHFMQRRSKFAFDAEDEDVVLEVELQEVLGQKVDWAKLIPLCHQYMNLEKATSMGDGTKGDAMDQDEEV